MIAAGLLLLLAAGAPPEARRTVLEAEIREAMQASQGFDLRATTNGARLQAEVARCGWRGERSRTMRPAPRCSSATRSGSPRT